MRTLWFTAGDGAVDEQKLCRDLLVDPQRFSFSRSSLYHVYTQLLHCLSIETLLSASGWLLEKTSDRPQSENHVAT